MSTWIKVSDSLPVSGAEVRTKIDDRDGVRNVCHLKYGLNSTRMWWTTDGGMYVYYTPTHWMYLS